MKLDTDIKHNVIVLAHTQWNCKYHIVFAPKYRRQINWIIVNKVDKKIRTKRKDFLAY